MNITSSTFPTFPTFSHWLTLVCAAGGLACVAALVLYSARHVLRELLDQLYAASRLTKLVVLLAFAGATLFGGAKHGSETNDPSGGVTGGNSPTNDPPESQCLNSGMFGCLNPPPVSNILNSNIQTLSVWTARGAWCDWKRIDFPDTFAFPSGTNLLTGVTLMSYGELRESLRGPVVVSFNQLLTTNQLTTSRFVSMEPNASSVNYGLTPSNTFVFVWENVCVNREATNRVNAAIELFEDGTIETRFGDEVGRVAPRPPQGFVGEGQDDDWSTNAFSFAASEIAKKGYQGWLDDYIGHNEPNGRYQVAVTVAALPEHGPCYLVVGPYRMVVTQPGTYSFPLEVFIEYHARTYPEAVPLSFVYDDGYRVDPVDPSWLMMSAPMPQMAGVDNGSSHDYVVTYEGKVYADPPRFDLSTESGRTLQLSCNASHVTVYTYTASNIGLEMCIYNFDEARLERADMAGYFTVYAQCGPYVAYGLIPVSSWTPPPIPFDPPSTNDVTHVSETNETSSAGEP